MIPDFLMPPKPVGPTVDHFGRWLEENMHDYQRYIREKIVYDPASMQWVDMGLGKSCSTLSAILDLFNKTETWGVLIVAPKLVCASVWRQEAKKWAHTSDLTFSLITGSKAERERALFTRANIYLINYENLVWLVNELQHRWLSNGRYMPFNTVVWDEVSKMKNTRMHQGVARGVAAVKMLPYVHRCIGLTGTPASNGFRDLFGQYLVVDRGERLGTGYGAYESKYFYNPTDDYSGYKFLPFPGSEDAISSIVGDITVNMNNEDYIDLPPFIFNDIELDMPQKLRAKYDFMEKEMLLEFDSGKELGIVNEASKIGRCLQFANGACFTAPGNPEWENLHDIKLAALEDIIEEAAGKPVLILYQFQHDLQKILKKFPRAVHISSRVKDFEKIVLDWNDGKIEMLIGHPLSIGHGLNIQAGSSTLVWYGLTWALDLYDQANARLRRQGQTKPVVVNRLLMRDTMDDAVKIALEMKAETEGSIRQAINKYRSKH